MAKGNKVPTLDGGTRRGSQPIRLNPSAVASGARKPSVTVDENCDITINSDIGGPVGIKIPWPRAVEMLRDIPAALKEKGLIVETTYSKKRDEFKTRTTMLESYHSSTRVKADAVGQQDEPEPDAEQEPESARQEPRQEARQEPPRRAQQTQIRQGAFAGNSRQVLPEPDEEDEEESSDVDD